MWGLLGWRDLHRRKRLTKYGAGIEMPEVNGCFTGKINYKEFCMTSKHSKMLKQCESTFHRLERQGNAETSSDWNILTWLFKTNFAQTTNQNRTLKTTKNNLVGQKKKTLIIQGKAPPTPSWRTTLSSTFKAPGASLGTRDDLTIGSSERHKLRQVLRVEPKSLGQIAFDTTDHVIWQCVKTLYPWWTSK